ncbi:related to Copper amine oxidase 1 [Sporisorium reilianum SRZ2]|uniref:Amine oxidase n=1 Tax=Sporisorium reilianum (strain SRZ2) TaxID=999809 RepID=E7A3C1_SPORE|nr:related to Copper amine oxidase 1 [Sporisorium reilianum SRZ2]
MAPTAVDVAGVSAISAASIPSKATKQASGAELHPLDDITPAENKLAVELLRDLHRNDGFEPWFKMIQRQEPRKAVLLPWLDAFHAGQNPAPLPRKLESIYIEPKTAKIHEAIIDVASQKVESHSVVPGNHRTNLDITQLEAFELAIVQHPLVKQALEQLGLDADTPIASDPWIYGADSFEDQPFLMQFLMYLKPPRNAHDGDAFHYSWPLPFVPVVDVNSGKITHVDWCYTGDSADGMVHTWKQGWAKSNMEEREYMPHLQKDFQPRAGLKPLIVQQPEGPSFTVSGKSVEWQGWKFRVAWTARKGLTLHDLRFKERSVFHRLSMSEMTVPYGDPRPPLHRKQAFDVGDASCGFTANSLSLGCDCLGAIHYFDGHLALPSGELLQQQNVVCMHEVDDGLGMKHTNYRTNNAYVVRRRTLVLQTIITVANYEYVFMWHFDQTGAISFETRATGVLSVSPIDAGKTSPYGNVVSRGVLGTNHQHIFCVRVDPRIDGDGNTVHYEDSVTMPFSTEEDKLLNPYGTGYTVQKTVLEHEGGANLDPMKNRTFKITNPNKINAISQKPVGYKMHLPATQLLLAHPDSVAYARAEFARHHVWVTKYRDDELWAGGKWTNQSNGKQGGVATYGKNKESTVNEDIVLWAVFGLTHNPRVEDFPVMPIESLMMSLKPNDFWETCPILDIATSTQAVNHSTLVSHREAEASSCCKK